MIRVNENYSRIKPTYLFAEIAARVAAHQKAHPDAKVIRLGIGDITEPLAPAVIAAMHRAVDDEAARATFHGYGPEQGYAFLRDKIAEVDFHARGVDVKADEIFGMRLCSLHNLRLLSKLIEDIRSAIEQDALRDFSEEFYARHGRGNW